MLDTFKNLEKCNCSKTRLLGKVYKAVPNKMKRESLQETQSHFQFLLTAIAHG